MCRYLGRLLCSRDDGTGRPLVVCMSSVSLHVCHTCNCYLSRPCMSHDRKFSCSRLAAGWGTAQGTAVKLACFSGDDQDAGACTQPPQVPSCFRAAASWGAAGVLPGGCTGHQVGALRQHAPHPGAPWRPPLPQGAPPPSSCTHAAGIPACHNLTAHAPLVGSRSLVLLP
jgi:hypothetical protein